MAVLIEALSVVVRRDTIARSQDKGLFCPEGWSFEHSLSAQFKFIPANESAAHLEFVRHERGTNVTVSRDRQTGQEVYLTRPVLLGDERNTNTGGEAAWREYEVLWAEATELIRPYFLLNVSLETSEQIAHVARSRDLFERITELIGDDWRPWLFLGVARHLLRDGQGAYAAFARAYGMAPSEQQVGRALAMECLALGYGPEAVAVTAAVVRLAPDNAGVIANHALALLVAGDLDGALREIELAACIDPDDDITCNLRTLIDDVRSGKVEAPSRFEF
jgi:Flp pilus assembly protein TadD